MSHQYQPTSYYNWPARSHGLFLDSGSYVYVPYDYYSGDEIHQQNVVFRDSRYVTYDNTHVRFLNRSDLHLYDTSGIVIHDSGTLTMYTSASPDARKFVVDEIGRVGIGMDHRQPHSNRGENPSFDLDVRGQVGVEDYIYHNDDVDTYMLFGSDLSAHYVNTVGEIHDIYPDDQDEINFRVGGVDILQMQTRDVNHLESGTKPTSAQDHMTINKYQSDVDVVIRSVDEPNMVFVDGENNRVSIGDSEDAPQATLEVKNDPSSGAFDVPLVQLNNKDTDKQLLDINADNIDADVISVSADMLVSADVVTITADNLTTGDVFNATADGLTSGSLIHMTHTGSDKSTVSLVHLESTGDRGHDVNETVLVDLNFDTTAGTASRTLRIDSEQTTGTVVEIDTTKLTTGKGLHIHTDDRTTGELMHLHDSSTTDTAGALLKIEQDGDRAGSEASVGVDINFDTTSNANARALRIDSEQTTGTVVEIDATEITSGTALAIDADKLTTGTGIELLMDARTTGTGVHIHDDSTTDSEGALVKIEQAGDRAGSEASVGVDINFDTTSNANARALKIDSEQTTGTVVEIDATEITSGTALAIDADKLTTGTGIELLMDARTTGTGVHIHDDSTTDTAGALVKIEQAGDRAGSAASVGVDINFDTTSNANARALRIDSEQTTGTVVEIDAQRVTSGVGMQLSAADITTGTGLEIGFNSRTTGTGVHIHDNNTTDSEGSLMLIEQTGNRAGSAASVGVDINFDTVANANARALRIDSEQTTGKVVEIDATPLTTGVGLWLHTDNRTTGTGLYIHDASTADSAGDLVMIKQDGNRTGDKSSVALHVDVDTTANVNARAFKIDSEQSTGKVIEVDANKITTGDALQISADAVTTGTIVDIDSNSASGSTRSLFRIKNDHTSATKTTLLHITNDAVASGGENAVALIESTAADQSSATLELRNENTAKDTPPTLRFYRNSNDTADNMDLGTVTFKGKNSEDESFVYAALSARATDDTNAKEAGQLNLMVAATDSASQLRNVLSIGGQNNSAGAEFVINEDQIDMDFRVESNTSSNAFVVYGDGSEVVINENSRSDTDFRVESDKSTKMLFVDASSDLVEIRGPANDDTLIFDVLGNNNASEAGASLFRVSPTSVTVNSDSNDVDFVVESNTNDHAFLVDGAGKEVVVNETGRNDTDFRVESNTGIAFATDAHPGQLTFDKQHALFVNTSTGGVGLGTKSPATTLHVVGDATIEGDMWVKGETKRMDTLVYVTSAMDIINKGTGPALTVTQNGVQPVAAFYDGNTNATDQWPALYIENGDEKGPGNVGIGTSDPTTDLEIVTTGRNDSNAGGALAVTTHSTQASDRSQLYIRTSRGTEAAPVKNADNDVLGEISFQGVSQKDTGAWAWNTGAQITARVNGTPGNNTVSDMPTELVFSTTPDGSKNPAQRMTIMSTGRVGVGNTATAPSNKMQIEHTAADFDDGLMIVNSSSSIADGTLLGGIGFDSKDGNVPSTITEASAFIAAYAAEAQSTSDKGADLKFGTTKINSDDDTATNIPMELSSEGTLTLQNNADGNESLKIKNIQTTADNRVGAEMEFTLQGSANHSGTKTHNGLEINQNCTSTTQNSTNKTRVRGVNVETSVSGEADSIIGLQSTAITDSKLSTATAEPSFIAGVAAYATNTRSITNVSQRGLYGSSTVYNNGSTSNTAADASYGIYGVHTNAKVGTTLTGKTTDAYGGHFEVKGDAGLITRAYGVDSLVSEGASGTITTGYLYKGTYSGNVFTKWGIHLTGSERNVIAGNLQIGTIGSTEETYTTLYADATDAIRIPAGTTSQRPASTIFNSNASTAYPLMQGLIRYNTTLSTFEGFGPGNQWGSLGGVIDTDRDTYWTAVNDLDNLHDLGGGKAGTDEFEPAPDYPGDVDYLRAFTTGRKRFAITNTGDVRWYNNHAGTGSTSDPYKYQTILQVKGDASGSTYTTTNITNETVGKSIKISTADTPATDDTTGGNVALIAGSGINRTTTGAGAEGGAINIYAGSGANAQDGNNDGGDGGDVTIKAGAKGNQTGTGQAGVAGVINLYTDKEVVIGTRGETEKATIDATGKGTFNTLDVGGSGGTVDSAGNADFTSLTLDTQLAVSEGGTGQVTHTTNGVLYGAGTNAIKATSAGADHHVLCGTGTAPAWETNIRLGGLGVGFAPTNGEIKCSGDITAFASSDSRLKTNIKPITQAIDKVKQISGYTFEWLEKEGVHSQTGEDVGVLAQEVNEVLPEVVTTRDNGYMAVKYEKITPLLIECIKEQQQQIELLKEQVELLKQQL